MRASARNLVIFGLVVLYAWCAVQIYRASAYPEASMGMGGGPATFFRSPGHPTANAGEERMHRAVEILNDRSLAPQERLIGYRAELLAAEALFLRSLDSNPAEARTLARLTAVRWELQSAYARTDQTPYVDMLRVAADLSPRIPGVQRDVAELELRMGRRDVAIPHFRRTLELDPSRASGVVATMHDGGIAAETIAVSLPDDPRVLAALLSVYLEEDALEEYLRLVESSEEQLHPELIESFTRACLLARQPARAERWLNRIDPGDDVELNAERLLQRAYAAGAMARHDEALEYALEARALMPGRVKFEESLGNFAAANGSYDIALEAYRTALNRLAVHSGSKAIRAKVYAHIGTIEESRGRPDSALDAYRLSVELNPKNSIAREALARMGDSTALQPSRPEPEP